MPTFRFRAQAALDLRRRDLESAERDLARAQRDAEAMAARLVGAEDACAGARSDATRVAQGTSTVTDLERYRFWITRLEHERHECQRLLTASEAVVERAADACQAALRRCKSLERFRDASRVRHEAAEAATERKNIDELATRRFAAVRARERTKP